MGCIAAGFDGDSAVAVEFNFVEPARPVQQLRDRGAVQGDEVGKPRAATTTVDIVPFLTLSFRVAIRARRRRGRSRTLDGEDCSERIEQPGN